MFYFWNSSIGGAKAGSENGLGSEDFVIFIIIIIIIVLAPTPFPCTMLSIYKTHTCFIFETVE